MTRHHTGNERLAQKFAFVKGKVIATQGGSRLLRRYGLAWAVIVVAAVVASVAAYAATPTDYIATCLFRVSRPTVDAAGSDFFAFNSALARNDVDQAAHTTVFRHAAASAGVSAAALRAHTGVVNPPANESTFAVNVTDADPARAARMANSVCQAFVADIAAQGERDRRTQAEGLARQIADLETAVRRIEAIPAAQRSITDTVTAKADQAAMTRLQTTLAAALSRPADLIDVVAQAGPGSRADTRSLGKNVVVGLVAALLGCFLIGLVGELVLEGRRRPAAPPSVPPPPSPESAQAV
jgi:uncharacterized protein involved in exopolysaccharide biosynthesis